MHPRDAPPGSPASHLSGSSTHPNHSPLISHSSTYNPHSVYQRSPLASPNAYPSTASVYGYDGSASTNRFSQAVHQLPHPDYPLTASATSGLASGSRISPYSSPQLRTLPRGIGSTRSSPEASSSTTPSYQRQPTKAPHPSASAGGVVPLPMSPLVNTADLSDASQHDSGTRGVGKRAEPPTKKRRTDGDGTSSREASVDPTRSAAPGSNDGKDGKPASRVAKACQPCSTKKRRCDGRQPECSVCQVLGSPCTYNHTGLKRGPPKGFRSGPKESAKAKLIRSLETTVRDLISHLGKEEAGSEILRVTGNRELGLSKEEGALGRQHQQQQQQPADRVPHSQIKRNVHDVLFTNSASKPPGAGGDEADSQEDNADSSDEDVIGDTRMGELVYRGSSSGIGILQRQHRAESPAPQQMSNAAGSASSASGFARPAGSATRLGKGPPHSLHGPPVFMPIASPRTSHQSGAGESPSSSHGRSPTQYQHSPKPEQRSPHQHKALQSLEGGSVPSAVDPEVSNEEHARLFRYYWQGFHPFWPLLYKPYMTSIPVEQLRRELEPCLIYAIYAIAACIVPGNRSTSSEEKRTMHDHERARLFCEAAERHTLHKGMRPDISTIQSCWLLCLYHHGTGDLSRAWNFQNLASSMAVDLGLHRWPIYRSQIVEDSLQRETRIRLIWHCYIMDKVLCSEMGRPVGLRAKDCDVPLLSETAEDELDLWSEQTDMQTGGTTVAAQQASGSEGPRHIHAPSCLNWGIHLFKIVENILDEVHSLRRKALLRKQGKEKVLADLDRQLANWKAKLPRHLHLDQEARDGPLPSFFALNLWFYTARLLLHRPFIPQEEGLSLAEVLANDSHKKSTEAANTICDLLEQSSTDFVDRLSTDLGYCLFTAAVMFVFNARLPDPQISSDARRRYGLCRKWLKKLADTWPAASAQKLLLDGFALVGEDASNSNGPPARRASIAALGMLQQQQMAADPRLAAPDGSNVSAWIAQTDAATKGPSSSDTVAASHYSGLSGPQPQLHQQQQQQGSESRDPNGRYNYFGANGQGAPSANASSSQGVRQAQAAMGPGGNGGDGGVSPFPFNGSHLQQPEGAFNAADLDFAPGIFDVESFFWNENVAMSAPFMQQTLGGYSGLGSAQQQPQQAQFEGFFGSASRPSQGEAGNVSVGTQQPTDGLSMLAQVTNDRHGPATASGSIDQHHFGGYGADTGGGRVRPGQQPPASMPNLLAQQQHQQQPGQPARTQQGQPGHQPAASLTPQPQPDRVHTGMTPFVYPIDSASQAANNHAMGEFWSMLELPPTFL